MLTAEVVIGGGGVIGASVAYHLAARGVRDVLVLERGARPGEGSTGRATGGFRAQFGTAVNVCLSLLSREKLLRFVDETGVDSGFRQCGYLFVARSAEELDALVSAQAVQFEGARTEGGGKVSSLLTSAGEVSAGVVVNAAGAWAASVARGVGVEIPVT